METTLSQLSLNDYKLDVTIHEDYITQYTPSEAHEQIITRWTENRELGSGAFGTVILQESDGGQLRAVKRLSRSRKGLDYSRELKTLSALTDHKQLFVSFIGWYGDKDSIFIAMEYIKYGDLYQYIKTPGAAHNVREITRQLLQGLSVPHERKICHRDLKPQNILIASPDPIWVKIADFGGSKNEEGTELITQIWTPGYFAPEMLGIHSEVPTRKSYTNAVDMWALGCIIHKILTSRTPFSEDTESSTTISGLAPDTIPLDSDETDIVALFNFCLGKTAFPVTYLEKCRVNDSGISLVRSLLVADPDRRASASEVLSGVYLKDIGFIEPLSGAQKLHPSAPSPPGVPNGLSATVLPQPGVWEDVTQGPTDVTPIERLRNCIKENRLETNVKGQYFVPRPVIGRLLTEDTVRAIINSVSVDLEFKKVLGDISEIVDTILNYSKKVFCILIWIRKPEEIFSLMDRRDVDLPLGASVVSAISGFYEAQWEYLSPTFDSVHLELHSDIILPFHSEERIERLDSSFSKVKIYCIHQMGMGELPHQVVRFTQTCSPDEIREKGCFLPIIALKRVSLDYDIALQLDTYKHLKRLQHPNIISLLGSYSHIGTDFLIFPYAKTTLHEMFENPRRHPDLLNNSSFYDSILGLSHALNSIHNYAASASHGKAATFRIHQKITPYTILVMRGRLVLSGFDNLRLTYGQQDPNSITYGAVSFASPEANRPYPRGSWLRPGKKGGYEDNSPMDIWSLGCVFYFIATYMLRGSQGVETLQKGIPGGATSRGPYSSGGQKREMNMSITSLAVVPSCSRKMRHLLVGIILMLEPRDALRLDSTRVLAHMRELFSPSTEPETQLVSEVSSQADIQSRLLWRDWIDCKTRLDESNRIAQLLNESGFL